MIDVTSILQDVNAYVSHVVGGNEFATGALLTALTTASLYFLRTVPATVAAFCRDQSITKIKVTNDGWSNRQAFISLAGFLKAHCVRAFSRSFRMESMYDYDTGQTTPVFAIGSGWHLIRYRKSFIVAHRAEHPNNNGDTLKEDITLYVKGRDYSILETLARECMATLVRGDVSINEWDYKEAKWVVSGHLTGYGLHSVALDAEVRDFFLREIDAFHEERDFLKRNGLPHKLTFLLHGLSGSGKTALIRALAAHYKLNLFLLNLASVTSGTSTTTIAKMLRNLPPRSILLMEDFDEAEGVKSRGRLDTIHTETADDEEATSTRRIPYYAYSSGGEKSDILNLLDGIVPLDGLITFLTTNVALQLDAAMLRAGRIDHVVDLPQVSCLAVQEHLELVWPELAGRPVRWSALPGCILYRIKREALSNVDKAEHLINFYHDNPEAAVAEQQGELEQLDRLRALREYIRQSDQESKDTEKLAECPAASV